MKRKNKNLLLKIFIFIISALAVYCVVAWQFNLPPFEKTVTQKSSEPEQTEQTKTQENNTENQSTETTKNIGEDIENPKTPIQNEGENPAKSTELTGYFTAKNVIDGKLVLRVTINQFLKSEGTCQLTLTHSSGKTVVKSAETFDNPSSATCKGFDIPTSELMSGKWKISLKVEADQKQGLIDGGEIDL